MVLVGVVIGSGRCVMVSLANILVVVVVSCWLSSSLLFSCYLVVMPLVFVVVVVSSPHQSSRCGVWRVEKVWKFWLPAMSAGNPAAKKQLPLAWSLVLVVWPVVGGMVNGSVEAMVGRRVGSGHGNTTHILPLSHVTVVVVLFVALAVVVMVIIVILGSGVYDWRAVNCIGNNKRCLITILYGLTIGDRWQVIGDRWPD